MLKRVVLIINLIFVSQFVFSQAKSRADRFFEKGDYTNAAKYYEIDLESSNHKKDLENIVISYYNTFEYGKATRYLRLLVNGRFVEDDKTYDNEFNFKYYQLLSALGDYEKGIDYLERYKGNDSIAFNKDDAISTIEDFKLMDSDYKIELAKFNSSASDFGAVKHNESVYFTSDRESESKLLEKKFKWTHRPFLDIYSVRVSEENDTIGGVVKLPESINSKLHEGNFCFSKNGLTIYVSRSNFVDGKKEFDEDDKNNIHLYKATLNEGIWSNLEKLPFNIEKYSYQHPALSPDEKKLYFSSNQDDSIGSFDLYYVDISDDGTFGEPVNLGTTINTVNREHFPFISDDGHLFFSSNGHLGLGMLDNFVSEFVDGAFTKPVNLGAPINSQYDDFSLNYTNKTQGFFASNRKYKDDNIYSFDQTGEIFIREYINKFEIRDQQTEDFVSNVSVTLIDRKGNLIYENTLDSIASFSKNLLANNYVLNASSQGYHNGVLRVKVLEEQDQKHLLYLEKLPPPKPPDPPDPPDPIEVIIAEKNIDEDLKEEDPKRFEMLTDVEGPPIVQKEGKLFFELEPIYFDFDKWDIREDSKVILDELAEKLERYPNIHIKISAHTDSRGSERYNQILSERRAESTRNYLALVGYVNARRIKFQGYGELWPLVDCPQSQCTDEEFQINRRSEFEIVKY
ncbi:OmpA family protein [Winogradskyella flava]|uniref:OmpA family protein n=1 Tax=Winogradskyella flava TaxID=1884876 RepID=A0A842IXU8_9FLAO|nr:OmpA family protein [Winogradskyella flava]MBC2846526.1 OmpA family protein [Winogradskyella flava]